MDESLPLEMPTEETPRTFLRMFFLVLSIAFFLGVLLYLMYHNGKSIYDNGL